MFERLKTIALTILVLLSLLQTYVLVYRTPQFEQAVQSDYVQTEQADILLDVEQLLKPRMIVAHLGEQVHSVFYPQTPVYGNMLETWRQFTYKNLQKTDMTLEEFYDQREQRLALSLQFEQDLELGTIQTLFNVTVDQEFQSQPLFDMLFAAPDPVENKMHIWFVSQNKRHVYKCTETDMSESEFTEMMVNASLQPVYRTYKNRFYIPEQPPTMTDVTMAYEKVEAAPLWQRLFIDPNITRNLTERDGTKIYTDGKRGLQIKNNGRYMVYSDPVAQQNYSGNLLESMRIGTQFINKHGGWSGDYLLHAMKVNVAEGESIYDFRQYYGSLPIIHPEESWFGYTRLKMKSGTVAGFQRPMVELTKAPKLDQEVLLPAGNELAARLDDLTKKAALRSLYPAYIAKWSGETVRLSPAWAVETDDGKWVWIR